MVSGMGNIGALRPVAHVKPQARSQALALERWQEMEALLYITLVAIGAAYVVTVAVVGGIALLSDVFGKEGNNKCVQ